MNDFVKIELAREIMNFMIGRHGQKGYDKSNKMLMQLLEDEKAMKKNDMAVACCVAGCGLWDGSFDFDYESGEMYYRMTASFIGSDIGEGLFRYMISMAGKVVDRYNDKLLAVCKGYLSLDDFIKEEDTEKKD